MKHNTTPPRASTGANAHTLKVGRLRDVAALMHSLRFHRPAIARLIGEPDSQRLATHAGAILDVLDRHGDALRAGVVEGRVTT